MSKVIQLHIYRAQDDEIEVPMVDAEVWLSQKSMAQLFGVEVKTVSEHISNIMHQDELGDSVIRKIRITADDGKQYNVNHYNLDIDQHDFSRYPSQWCPLIRERQFAPQPHHHLRRVCIGACIQQYRADLMLQAQVARLRLVSLSIRLLPTTGGAVAGVRPFARHRTPTVCT